MQPPKSHTKQSYCYLAEYCCPKSSPDSDSSPPFMEKMRVTSLERIVFVGKKSIDDAPLHISELPDRESGNSQRHDDQHQC